MKRLTIAAALTIASITAAPAQQVAPPAGFVPFMVTQKDVETLQTYFDRNTPPAYSGPVIQWLSGIEARASAEAQAKAAADKAQADVDAKARAALDAQAKAKADADAKAKEKPADKK